MKFPLKKKLLVVALVPAFGLPLAASSFAQASGAQDQQTQQTQQNQQQVQAGTEQQQAGQQQQQMVRDLRASEIIGAEVVDQQGQELGKVQDLIVDLGNEKAEYAILATGGVLGFNEKLFAFPMERFQATGGEEVQLALDVSEQELKEAPGFDKSNWPSWGKGGYRGEVDKHFGRTAAEGGDLVRMSELLDHSVSDQAGNEIGQIEDVVLSVTDGQIRFVALNPAEELKMEDRLAVIPLEALQATSEQAFQQQTGAGEADEQQAQQATGGAAEAERQAGAPEQEQAQQATGAPGQEQEATGGVQQQQAAGQEQQQEKERELKLVLAVEPQQLQNARTFEEGKWPELNDSAFQQDMERYVAAFPAGDTAATGGTEAGGASAAGEAQQQTAPSAQPEVEQDKPAAPGAGQTSGAPAQPDVPPPSANPADAGLAYERPAGMGFPPGSERQESPPEWAPSPRN